MLAFNSASPAKIFSEHAAPVISTARTHLHWRQPEWPEQHLFDGTRSLLILLCVTLSLLDDGPRRSFRDHAARNRSHGVRIAVSGCTICAASPSGSVKLHNPVGSPGRVVFCAIPVRSVSTTISPNLDMICYALGGGRRIPVNSPRVSFG